MFSTFFVIDPRMIDLASIDSRTKCNERVCYEISDVIFRPRYIPMSSKRIHVDGVTVNVA